MIDESPLERVKSNITVEFESDAQAKIIYDSIILEFETAPDSIPRIAEEISYK